MLLLPSSLFPLTLIKTDVLLIFSNGSANTAEVQHYSGERFNTNIAQKSKDVTILSCPQLSEYIDLPDRRVTTVTSSRHRYVKPQTYF